ncbi:pyridoxal phosphate-dependent aminotransferase [candidate division CSSED10-310 bacterium]|uniref:Aminotransferase n=1 Tax=candidate division CSSED10-310 bacterium TaxID=2855610 RepID=A0ABV6YXL6_UNCC1
MSTLEELKQVVEKPEDMTPLLTCAWEYMPEGMHYCVSTAPIIPAIVARAKSIAAETPDFIRSDQGQVVGIMPEKEIYYGPSAGIDELRQLIARFWTLAYHLKDKELGKHNVAIVSGATEGLAIVLRMFAYQQNVGVMHLFWSNYKGIILNSGGNPIVVSLFDKNYNLDLEKTEQTIRSQKVTSLLINFPTNPSGDVLTDDELVSLAELARKLNLIIIADEVYNYLRYKGQPQSMLAYAPERTVVVSSASKEYLMPGARVGYVLADNKTFINSWILRLIRASSSSANVLGQRLLIDILKDEVKDLEENRPPRIISEIKKELGIRRDLMISILKNRGLTLAGRDQDYPSGAISVLAKLPEDIKIDDKIFVEKALELHKFSAIPGSVFGAPGCLRFGYAGMTEENIKKFGVKLGDVLDHVRDR